jgi:hypothetical protein
VKRAALLLAALALVAGLAGCDKRKGDPCDNAGDVWGKGGTILVCTQTPGGLVWQ